MGRAIEAKLHKLLEVSKVAGLIVTGAEIEGDKIRLTYEQARDTLPADLINWKRPTK